MLGEKTRSNLLVILWVSVIVLDLFLTSCGTRKVNKSETKETEKTEVVSVKTEVAELEENTKTEVLSNSNSLDESTTETTVITPLDATKPAFFTDEKGNKKELFNSAYKKKVVKKHLTQKSESKAVSNTAIKAKTAANDNSKAVAVKTKEAGSKTIDREIAFSLWCLLWLLIPIALYLAYRKYRDKIWWV